MVSLRNWWLLAAFATFLIASAAPALAEVRNDAFRVESIWWLPDCISWHGHYCDNFFHALFALTFGVFIVVAIIGGVFVVKYRYRPGVRAVYSHGNDLYEIIWTAAPTVVFIFIGLYSQHLWNFIHKAPDDPDTVTVDVVAYQFGWNFRYAGVDGKFGADKMELLTGGNPHGKVEGDPAGVDDIETTDLVIPVDTVIRLNLRSRDVIHSFYMPMLRLYQDALPGKKITWSWFKAERVGDYQIACSQLCGTGHYNMKAPFKILPKEEFKKWLAEKEEARRQAAQASISSPHQGEIVVAANK